MIFQKRRIYPTSRPFYKFMRYYQMVTSYILYIENHFAVCRYWPHGRRQEYFQSIHSLPQFIHNWQDSIPISICHFLHTGLCCCHSSNLFQLLNGIISLFGFFCYLLNQILFYASANINALLYSNCISQFLGVSQASRNVFFFAISIMVKASMLMVLE